MKILDFFRIMIEAGIVPVDFNVDRSAFSDFPGVTLTVYFEEKEFNLMKELLERLDLPSKELDDYERADGEFLGGFIIFLGE